MATVRDEEKFPNDSQVTSRPKDTEEVVAGNMVTTVPLEGITPTDSVDLHSEEKPLNAEVEYPDGGLRAWLIVFGVSFSCSNDCLGMH